MPKIFHWLACSVALTSLSSVHAGGIDLALGSNSGSIAYLNSSEGIGYGGSDLGIGLFWNDDDDFLVNASLMVTGNNIDTESGMQFGIGGKAFLGEVDKPGVDVGAVALSGMARYILPTAMPTAVTLGVHWAPEISSFQDIEELTEFNVRIEAEITNGARAFIGYRSIEVGVDGGADEELDDGLHLGVRLVF